MKEEKGTQKTSSLVVVVKGIRRENLLSTAEKKESFVNNAGRTHAENNNGRKRFNPSNCCSK